VSAFQIEPAKQAVSGPCMAEQTCTRRGTRRVVIAGYHLTTDGYLDLCAKHAEEAERIWEAALNGWPEEKAA